MTFEDPRNQGQQRVLTLEEMQKIESLEKDAELRQLATEALIINESEDRNLRADLRQPRMTNIEYRDAGKHVQLERESMATLLEEHARGITTPRPELGGRTQAEEMLARDPNAKLNVPQLAADEGLEYAGLADPKDVMRAGISFEAQREAIERGIPLTSQVNENIILGPAPGDLENSKDSYRKLRSASGFNGYALYRRVKKQPAAEAPKDVG